jgi:hypothetical protein
MKVVDYLRSIPYAQTWCLDRFSGTSARWQRCQGWCIMIERFRHLTRAFMGSGGAGRSVAILIASLASHTIRLFQQTDWRLLLLPTIRVIVFALYSWWVNRLASATAELQRWHEADCHETLYNSGHCAAASRWDSCIGGSRSSTPFTGPSLCVLCMLVEADRGEKSQWVL